MSSLGLASQGSVFDSAWERLVFLSWWRLLGRVLKGCAAAVSSRWQCCPVAEHGGESSEILKPAKHAFRYVSETLIGHILFCLNLG